MAFEIDTSIIKRLSEGDQSAFRVVFEYYYPRIWEFVRRIVKSETLAEDIPRIYLSRFGSVAKSSVSRYTHLPSIYT